MTEPSRPGRFGGVRAIKQDVEEPNTANQPSPTGETAPPSRQEPAGATIAPSGAGSSAPAPTTAPAGKERGRGVNPSTTPAHLDPTPNLRQRGKRSDPDFAQVSAYVRKATYRATQRRLFEMNDAGDPRDFSDVVETLLAGWLSGKFKA